MDKLTHVAALRAAAKVAFGVTVLAGCTAAATEQDETVASEAEVNKAEPPCHRDAGKQPDAKPSCESVLASTFGDAGNDFMSSQDPKPVSDDVKSCCVEHLTSETVETWKLQYRWACCGVLDTWNNPDPKISIACTPWGPPVPPKMRAVA